MIFLIRFGILWWKYLRDLKKGDDIDFSTYLKELQKHFGPKQGISI